MPFQPINVGAIQQQRQASQSNRLSDLLRAQQLDPQSPNNQLARLQVEAQRLKNNALRNPQQADIGQVNPRDFTAGSIAKFRNTGDFNDLVRHQGKQRGIRVDVGDAVEIYHPTTSQLLRRIPKNIPLTERPEFLGEQETAKTEAQLRAEAGEGGGPSKASIAESVADAKGQANRRQEFIDAGVTACDAYPVIARGLQLLNQGVKTGGFDNMQLAVTNFFGVTGADEAELSNNLGKAVLSQLRATFGAAFTQEEGKRLERIEANFGKSTAGNIRLLEQTEKIVKRAANRGIRAARASGDEATALEIEQALAFTLEPTTSTRIRFDSQGNRVD